MLPLFSNNGNFCRYQSTPLYLVATTEIPKEPPQEITAEELFDLWVDKVKNKYTNGLIPILWCIECREQGKFEFMPFQYQDYELKRDFLTYFSWPINKNSGKDLNWLSLPVVDKLWNNKHCDKGGFIQQATGWKPGILQPYVYLDSLLQLR